VGGEGRHGGDLSIAAVASKTLAAKSLTVLSLAAKSLTTAEPTK
jgi:hypothetical protein